MLKDITLGQYFPGNSLIHKLDPRTKIILMILYMIIVFLAQKIWLLIPISAFVTLALLLSQVPANYFLRSLKPLRFILIFMFIINLFVIQTGKPIVSFWIIKITDEAVYRALFISFRLILLVAGSSLIILTTTPISLTDGLERLLSPLKRIKFPAHELAMMMTIALRFIPTLIEETDRIMKAQLSRGADFETGSIIKRAKALIPILVPLFVSAFRRADELALAMESRCYHGGEGRTKMHILKFARYDLYAVLCTTALGVIVVLFNQILK
ncbi:MAG: energy-coupling factor transporter transmembrane component T [Clostridia bacterium]